MKKRGTPLPVVTANGQKQQAPFRAVADVFRAALLLGAGGGFALACVLTVSSMSGMALGSWWLALAQAHGDVQVYGWAGLFVIGVSLHFLPRLRGTPLVALWPLKWLLGMQAGALVCSVWGWQSAWPGISGPR